MRPPSPALAATLRALHGEPDVHVVAPALSDQQVARILALAPGVDPVIGALGALAGKVPDLLTPGAIESPALHAAIASLIGTDAGARILPWWAEVAPAGWGASHTAALIDAVQRNRCEPWVAAALIGPSVTSATLLRHVYDIARAVRYWGQATPDHPTAWMDDVTKAERDRLLDALRTTPNNAAVCWPWLPDAIAVDIIGRIARFFLPFALDAYIAASPVTHTRHAVALFTLIRRTKRYSPATVTRLAVATGIDAAWNAIVHLLRTNPRSAIRVVTATPWNDMRADARTVILSAGDHNDVCAAIAFARGARPDPPAITQDTACAFFATVTQEVWGTLPKEIQCAWRSTLDAWNTHLAVRSLGLDPAFLARTRLDDDVIAAVRCHAGNESVMRWVLLPVAVRDLPIAAVSRIVATLPAPPDPVAFVQIASGTREMPSGLRDWITAHQTPQAHVAAVTVLHAAAQSGSTADRCTALAVAFAGRSSEEATAFLAALPDDAHTALHPPPDALVNTLAHLNRRDAFRQALDALSALPPAATHPALLALGTMGAASTLDQRRQAGTALAQALRHHGDCFLALVTTLADAPRTAILPRPRSVTHAAAVRAIAATDPLVAHHLAHALRKGEADATLDALMDAPFDALTRIWRLLPEDLQQFVLGDRDALLTNVAASGCADALTQTLRAWDTNNPRPLLALRMLIDDNEARRARGAALLAQQTDVAAAILPLLREDLRTTLAADPTIAFASADLPPPPPLAPVRRRR